MEKQSLRNEMTLRLSQLQLVTKERYEKAMHKRILTSNLWKDASVIGLTHAQNTEWNTVLLIEAAFEAGKTVCLPKCNPKTNTMKFYAIQHLDELKSGYAGILEPDLTFNLSPIMQEKIDLLIVPGVVFDKRGFRSGYGGGYYDRFLENFGGITISLAAEFQLVEQLPKESFDLPVQHIFTEERLLVTSKSI